MTTHSLDDPEDEFASTRPEQTDSGDVAKVPPEPRARPGVWRFAAELPVGQYAIPTDPPSPELVAGTTGDDFAPGTFADSNGASTIDYDAPLKLAPANAPFVDGDGSMQTASAPSEFEFSPRPDLLLPRTAGDPFTEEDSWFDLWGFRALVWGLGAGAIALLVALGMRLNESKLEEGSLAALGARSQAAVVKAAPVTSPPPVAMPAPVIVATPAPLVPPVVLPAPEPISPEIAEVTPKVEQAEAPPARPRIVARRQPKAVPAVKPKPARLARRTDRKAAPVAMAREPRPVARAPRVVKAPSETPLTAQARLLKECRAYGYHAERCVERGCVLTKFGLACKGK